MTIKDSPLTGDPDNSAIQSRRNLMKLAAVGGVSLAALKFLGPSMAHAATPAATPAQPDGLTGGPTDGDTQFAAIPGNSINEKVLNFALTLEFLEADLYRQALNLASGKPLTMPLDPIARKYSLVVPSGGLSAGATQAGYLYLQEFTYVEAEHVQYITGVMTRAGMTPVTANPGGYKFASAPAANLKAILTGILPLEETGVRAYLGALPYLTDLHVAQDAAGIYSTEARHSAAISYILGIDPGPMAMPGDNTVVASPPASNTFEYYLHPLQVIAAIQPLFA
jgi:hypothetical protein